MKEFLIRLYNGKDEHLHFALLLNRIKSCNREQTVLHILFSIVFILLLSLVLSFHCLLISQLHSSYTRFQRQQYVSDDPDCDDGDSIFVRNVGTTSQARRRLLGIVIVTARVKSPWLNIK